MKKIGISISFVLALFTFLSGCAQKGPVLVDFRYQSAIETPAGAPAAVVVGVSPFKDERGKSSSVVGKRFLSLTDKANDLVVQGIVSDKVTTALNNAMKTRNIAVKDFPAWDLTKEGLPVDGANLLISGEIKTLWVETTSTLANTKAKANADLRVVVADLEQKKIVRTLNLSSTIERQSVTFSPAFVEGVLSEAVSIAFNQIFNDEELKNRLK